MASKPTAINNYVQNPSGVWVPAKGDALGNTVTSPTSDYPLGSTPVTGSSGNLANAAAAVHLGSVSGKTTYIAGFEITGTGATAVNIVTVTIVNILGGTLSYTYVFVAGVTNQNQSLIVEFTKAIPGSAQNTDIIVNCPASGAGGTNNTVVVHGYQL